MLRMERMEEIMPNPPLAVRREIAAVTTAKDVEDVAAGSHLHPSLLPARQEGSRRVDVGPNRHAVAVVACDRDVARHSTRPLLVSRSGADDFGARASLRQARPLRRGARGGQREHEEREEAGDSSLRRHHAAIVAPERCARAASLLVVFVLSGRPRLRSTSDAGVGKARLEFLEPEQPIHAPLVRLLESPLGLLLSGRRGHRWRRLLRRLPLWQLPASRALARSARRLQREPS